MSSYYTAAELEAMRREKLKKELQQSIDRLREQLSVQRENTVTVLCSQNIETFAGDNGEGSSGYAFTGVIAAELSCREQAVEKTEENDFSALLSISKQPTKLERELEGWVKRVEERAILSESDAKARSRVMSELSKIIARSGVDIEDKIRAVSMRVKSYLQGGTPLAELDRAALEKEYYEYCALCKLLETEPVETLPYKIKGEIRRMRAVLEKKAENEYIMSTIEEIMGKLGCRMKEDAILDHTEGLLFSVDGAPACDVFVGADGSGIMFEPIVEAKGGSLEKRRQLEQSLSSVCSLYSELEELAAKKGVILRRVYADPPAVDTVCEQSELQHSAEKRSKRKARAEKLKAKEVE